MSGQWRIKGETLKAGLVSLKERSPSLIRDVRGAGLLLAVEFVNSDVGYDVAKGTFARNVMTAGTLNNVRCIRFESAAVISDEEIATIVARMGEALEDVLPVHKCGQCEFAQVNSHRIDKA